tara:strand:+ start:10908 stop:11651 length:744 start_codon:yes stop_codon:yes gene_type:complete
MKIEFDSQDPVQMEMMSRMFNPLLGAAARTVAANVAATGDAVIVPQGTEPEVEQVVVVNPEIHGHDSIVPNEPRGPLGDNEVVGAVDMTSLDAAGMPWDERICSGGRTKKADGTWVAKRGVDKEVIRAVKEELIAVMNVAPQVAVGVNQVTAITVVENAAIATADSVQAAAVFGGQQSSPMAAAGNVASPVVATWPDVLQIVATKRADGTLTDEHIQNFLSHHNLSAFQLLANRSDLFPAFLDFMQC